MRRRAFITLLGGTAAAWWPLAARAQQPMPVVGILAAGGPLLAMRASFEHGLAETGFVQRRNLRIVERATDQYEQLPALAAELINLPVSAIFAAGTANSALIVRKASTTIPIVFANGSDPVRIGLVASMNRPEANVTGVTYFASGLVAKRLEHLRELVPNADLIALLVNPANERAEYDIAEVEQASRAVNQRLMVLRAGRPAELEQAFAAMEERRVSAVLVGGDAFFARQPQLLVALAARHGVPASYATRSAAEAGGLMSYSDDRSESYRQAGLYVGRILKGEKPVDLPVLQPTKFEFVINLKTAKALGITFPPSFHLRADEVIE